MSLFFVCTFNSFEVKTYLYMHGLGIILNKQWLSWLPDDVVTKCENNKIHYVTFKSNN